MPDPCTRCVRMDWERSRFCEDAACVEVHTTPDAVSVRQSSNPAVVLRFTHTEWQAFLDGVAAGQFRPHRPEGDRS